MNTTTEKSESKAAATRLLDLLHGWGDYVESENGAYPDTLTADEIADLYQAAGGIAAHDFPDTESEQAAVCKFVVQRVLPALYQD